MARKRITRKPERERFDREVRRMLVEEFGAVDQGDDAYHKYRMITKAGPLGISIHEGVESPGNVMTRFDFAIQGEALVGASVPSGKWNYHFSPGVSCDEALQTIRVSFERIQATTLEHFMDTTSIVPQAIVETVLQERAIVDEVGCRGRLRMVDPPYMSAEMGRLEFVGNVAWFTHHCEERLVTLWDSNPHIRRKLLKTRSESGLDTAYAFIHHWLDAFIENKPDYRKEHPLWRPLEPTADATELVQPSAGGVTPGPPRSSPAVGGALGFSDTGKWRCER